MCSKIDELILFGWIDWYLYKIFKIIQFDIRDESYEEFYFVDNEGRKTNEAKLLYTIFKISK